MPTRWTVAGLAGLLAASVALASSKIAVGDQWPRRPLTMVEPFAAGGPTGVVGRIVATEAAGPHSS